MAHDEAVRMLTAAPVMRMAGTTPEGLPVMRSLHGVVDDGWLCFHASPAGEKTELVGQEVLCAVEEELVRIPSHFIEPERACPATTLYRSVHLRGRLTAIDDPERKARILQALMRKLQPEGGYRPITAEDPMYRSAVRGLLLAGVPLAGLTGKAKLGQNRTPDQRTRMLECLWQRGGPGDVRAIHEVLIANPDTPTPEFLQAPDGLRLLISPGEARIPELLALAPEMPWNRHFSLQELAEVHLESTAWVACVDSSGALIGSARAFSDGAKFAWIQDVVVAPAHRKKGVARRLMALLLDHPAIRRARRVHLRTVLGERLYASCGFVRRAAWTEPGADSLEMVLVRAKPDPAVVPV